WTSITTMVRKTTQQKKSMSTSTSNTTTADSSSTSTITKPYGYKTLKSNPAEHYDHFDSPIGPMEFFANDKGLVLITFFPLHKPNVDSMKPNLITNQFKQQLTDYFSGDLLDFTVPVDWDAGTEFQQKAWKALCDVKFGETASYSDVAKAIGKANAPRAVATACRLNKFPLIVPCHRIVSSKGEVVGYMGKGGIPKQHFLYDHEQAVLKEAKSNNIKCSRISRRC
ncbi:hypothetical protein SAMD00019534_059170, partial [Acytostelium subglobosum LB1]|uniref:hypothetical protein n=1 Tax=Acytostelium subglobosum LB1 TaxID=1410327 RepID=UPI0006450AF3